MDEERRDIPIGPQPKKTYRWEDEHEPKLIEGALKGQRVIDVSAGGGQSLVEGGPAFSVIVQCDRTTTNFF